MAVTDDDLNTNRGFCQPQRVKSDAEVEYDLGQEIIQADQMIAYYRDRAAKAIGQLDAIRLERERNAPRSIYRGSLREAKEVTTGQDTHEGEKPKTRR